MADLLVVAALDEEVVELRRRHPELAVLVTGPGKVLAAAGLAAAIAADRPAAVLVLGTAGGLTAGHEGVHEIAVVGQHDFDAAAIASLVGRSYGPPIVLAGPADPGEHLATGDVFVADAEHVGRLNALGYGLVDMEGYAYAHVCQAAGLPVRIVKAVSDLADGSAAMSWAANVQRCSKLLADWYDEFGLVPGLTTD
jgi:adenosylhomocysteine nucleosidase